MSKNKIICLVLFAITILSFAVFYFSNHTYGALGDDSPGYIFMASRYFHGESPIFKDKLISELSEKYDYSTSKYNKDEIDFALPHFSYKLINSEGKIAPKSPVGAPYLMAMFGKIFGEQGFYYLNPLCGILILIGLYLIVVELLRANKYNHWIALSSVLILGITNQFWGYVMMEPLREVPALAFMMFSLFFFIKATRKDSFLYFAISAFLFGWSINIRETAILFGLCLPIFYLLEKRKLNFKKIIAYSLLFIIVFSATYSFSIINNSNAKNELKSVQGESLAPNADHLKNVKIKNWWDNQGKFRPGVGGVVIYYRLIKEMFIIPQALIVGLLGLIYLFKKNWRVAIFILSAIIPTYLFFAAWINPYHRYIYGIFPFLTILLALGLFMLIKFVVRNASNIFFKISIPILLVGAIIVYSVPMISNAHDVITKRSLPSSRSIAKSDFNQIKEIELTGDNPLLICIGNSSYMAAYIEAHTQIRTIKSPDNDLILEVIGYLQERNYSVYIWDDGTDDVVMSKIKGEFELIKNSDYEFEFKGSDERNSNPGNVVSVYKLEENENITD